MKKQIVLSGLIVLGAAVLAWGIYIWCFCRFYVPPEHMAIVTAKSGKTPSSGTLLVEKGEKGIWREVLPEGQVGGPKRS